MLYNERFSKSKEGFFSLGITGGIKLLTKAKGTTEYKLKDSNGKTEINKSGLDFFNRFYYGGIARISPGFNKWLLQPGLELSYYPDYFKIGGTSKSMAMVSVTIGLGKMHSEIIK